MPILFHAANHLIKIFDGKKRQQVKPRFSFISKKKNIFLVDMQ